MSKKSADEIGHRAASGQDSAPGAGGEPRDQAGAAARPRAVPTGEAGSPGAGLDGPPDGAQTHARGEGAAGAEGSPESGGDDAGQGVGPGRDAGPAPSVTDLDAGQAGPSQGASTRPEPSGAADALAVAQRELAAQKQRAEHLYDQLLRLGADFDNYRKRVQRDRDREVERSLEGLLRHLLEVADNLERALSAMGDLDALAAHRDGMRAIQGLVLSSLAEQGVTPIDAAGQPFDPRIHEAVGQHETADLPEGHVALELQRGYRIRDRVLRPSRVMVAKAPAGAADNGAGAATGGDGSAREDSGRRGGKLD